MAARSLLERVVRISIRTLSFVPRPCMGGDVSTKGNCTNTHTHTHTHTHTYTRTQIRISHTHTHTHLHRFLQAHRIQLVLRKNQSLQQKAEISGRVVFDVLEHTALVVKVVGLKKKQKTINDHAIICSIVWFKHTSFWVHHTQQISLRVQISFIFAFFFILSILVFNKFPSNTRIPEQWTAAERECALQYRQ